MKQITLKTITMVNFRGIQDLTIDFKSTETQIRGANATGKSTVFNAFVWLLFGKDQFGKSEFDIKPLTPSGEPVHNLDSIVSAILSVDGQEIMLKKVYREKWEKKRGKTEVVFNGHETEYIYNQVPVTMREYNAMVSQISPEDLFRLLTNPLYFPMLPWKDQRATLFAMAGEIDDNEIIRGDKAMQEIFKRINGHKTIEMYLREISMEKRKIKDDLDKIPSRIDEAQRSTPVVTEDWKAIETSILEKDNLIKSIDKEISDLSASMEVSFADYRKSQIELNNKKNEIARIEQETKKKHQDNKVSLLEKESTMNRKLSLLQEELTAIERSVSNLENEKQGYINEREILRAEWRKINEVSQVFLQDSEFVCPTCKRELDEIAIESKKQEMMAKHNLDKASRLKVNESKGKNLSALITDITEKITAKNSMKVNAINEITALKEEQKTVHELVSLFDVEANIKNDLDENQLYNNLKLQVIALAKSIGSEPVKIDITAQTDRKAEIQLELKDLIQRLNNREFIERAKKRVNELREEEQVLAQKLADLEKTEFAIAGFTKAKISVIEERINGMFSIVKWKLFEQQVNGGETETCTLMVNGVPFNSLNNAMKYQAGVDVINALSRHYNITAPIFFDNREGVSELPETQSQIISLYVDSKCTTLSIN